MSGIKKTGSFLNGYLLKERLSFSFTESVTKVETGIYPSETINIFANITNPGTVIGSFSIAKV